MSLSSWSLLSAVLVAAGFGQSIRVGEFQQQVRSSATGKPAFGDVTTASHGSLTAKAAKTGLSERGADGVWRELHPSDGRRSWAPADVRAVAYDQRGWLYFVSPQGLGVRDDKGAWRLYDTTDGLPYDDFTAVAPAPDGSVWMGTHIGAIRFDGKTWEYRQGKRWLPGDDVRAIAIAGNQVYFDTNGGVGAIEWKPQTLARKAQTFEEAIDRYHRRTPYGYVLGVRAEKPGDPSQTTQSDSDNDGLWTSMYGAGEAFACAAGNTKACERAKAAFEALRFLGTVTQGGPHPAPRGFVARSILPANGPDPNKHDSPEHDRQRRATRDSLWKVIEPRWPLSADGKWYWKSDTSSDELDGHFFFYGLYYDLVAKTDEEKRRVREHVDALAGHLVDHGFRLIDHDGKVTRWGVFDPASLNHDPEWWEERSLNSISILAYLQVAAHITGNERYRQAARTLITQHSYEMNTIIPKNPYGPGAGNQSDDEMAFMCLYHLVRYETNPALRTIYERSLRQRWLIERPELCPLFDFIAAAALKEPAGAWLEESADTLKRYPVDRFDWGLRNSHRKDIKPLPRYVWESEEDRGRGSRADGRVLPIDERYVDYWNHDPWRLDRSGSGHHLGDGASYLLPYYMGLYQGFLRE